MNIEEIESHIGKVPDYPKPGILFYDISTLICNKDAFSSSIRHLGGLLDKYEFDYIAAIDARGFIFGSSVANILDCGMVMIRKKNKLPGKTISYEYELEYGSDILEINIDAKDKKFVVVDDLLATGGTANAAINLLKKAGGETICFAALIELSFLNARKNLKVPIETLIKY
tara:strand:+ start:2458 stop:2970 length:513 start_codon:yes stop_codon:yes gene_type:complete